MSLEVEKREEPKSSSEVQLIAFYLKEEEFAVEIHQVKEVLRLGKITPIPQTLDFVEGVIDLRGEVIPIIDLRKRFDLCIGERNGEARIAIVEINGKDMGLIVDSMNEVLRLPEEQIHPPPDGIAGARTDLIKAVGKKDERLIILLNLGKILTTEERISLEEVTIKEDSGITQ